MHSARRLVPMFAWLLLAGVAVAQTPLGPKPLRTLVTAGHRPDAIDVKFIQNSGVRLSAGRFVDPAGRRPDLEAINAFLAAAGASPARLFPVGDDVLETWRREGERRRGRPLHDLRLFFRVRLSQPGTAAAVCDTLNRFAVVELAYPVPGVSDPRATAVPRTASDPSPDFESLQGYRDAAPTGIDADYGNTFSGGQGTGTLIGDVETGWTDDHEDIRHKAEGRIVGSITPNYPWDHGTAVLGELIGENNQSGVKGIVYDADVVMSSHGGFDVAGATASAIAELAAGDILVLEVQCSGGPPGPYPCEYDDSIYALVETATANGIHVFAAAGNGNRNLDLPDYGGKFNRAVRDSGAVICGASDGVSLNKAGFSNYGSRVDVHGWGYNVTTAGYGDLYGTDVRNEYTDGFNGTSSATPIVTGAGAILNSIHRTDYGTPLDPLALRSLLASTGTPQGSGGNIGPRPNVRAAIESLNLPRIALGAVSPAAATIQIKGQAGDDYVLLYATAVRTAPVQLDPFGYLFLGGRVGTAAQGTIPPSGVAEVTLPVAPDPGLPGVPAGAYFQAVEVFRNGQPGTGAFTNYLRAQ